jgi:AcrR family transcriptional regulator
MQGKKRKNRQARQPVQERGIETRERIVRAAREMFEQKGFHGTNSKEIAARAGVAVGTFYGYFKEKKPLFMEVITRYYHEIAEAALTVREDDLKELGNPRKLVGILVHRMLDAHTLSPDLHREIIAMIFGDQEIEQMVHEKEEEVIQRLVSMLQIVQDKLTVTDLEAAARIVHRTAEENIHAIRIFGSPIEEKRLVHELEEMLYRYLFT